MNDARQCLVRGDYVGAFLLYDEACDLEVSISGGLGETSISGYEAGEFVERLLNTPDGALMQVLQSDRVSIGKKKGLIRGLDAEVEENAFRASPNQ